ncbi:MAG: hypothetical protein LBN74_04145 [Prevotella sp.]|jgi:hypothetical protein|nr:hypothetical protein [Prevotella sp.]
MKYKLFILFCLIQTISVSAFAQDHLKVKDIFDKYGKQEGSVLVQLSSDVLSQGSNITFYKSLIMDNNIARERDVLNLLKPDIEMNSIISEVNKNGKIESGTYYVGKGKSEKSSEFILYRNKADKITIVYLKGNFPPAKLDSELKKLKDLFIYVNNKRLKIQ